MDIKNILVVSPMYNEIEKLINGKNVPTGKQFRYMPSENVTPEDYQWADAFVSFKRPANFSFENIKWVHSFGAGVDKLLKGGTWKKDVVLTRTICSFGEKISEYSLSYILRDLQNHDTYWSLKENKEWNEIPPTPINEKKVVVFGTGVIGQEVARTLSFFGVKIFGVSLSGKQKDYFQEVFSSESQAFQAILPKVDYLINTMPLTEKTTNLFDEALFNQLENAFFINVGRGESVDNEALLKALSNGKVRKAVLDVFPEEPLPVTDPFWEHPNVVVTPHISALTTAEEGVDCFLDTLYKMEENKELPNVVDLSKGF